MVSTKQKPEGAGEEFKKMQSKKNQFTTSEFFIPNWKGTSLELVLYVLCKHYASHEIVEQIKAGAELPDHPILHEDLFGMGTNSALSAKYKKVFQVLFIKRKKG